MTMRYIDPAEYITEFENDLLVADNLTNLCPVFIEFLPTPEVMR